MQKYNYGELIKFLNQAANTSEETHQLENDYTKYPFLILLLDLWGTYEQDIVRIIQEYKESNKMLEVKGDFEWILSLNNNQIFEIVDLINWVQSNLIQAIMSEPESMHKIPLDNPRRPRLFLENIYHDLFHDKPDLYNPKLIKYLFDEERNLTKDS
jgi:hypothetical protein